ncbi:uncharacterized protein F4812DRAFT_463111 [Daldinia caldariorum]|uniref:uncharacterized protein n=1 Tax=Daldinia caldariorum TaxID=326644 RepID=UPI00200860BA|nr:uncharacterized protein F4812DRAFT_463111 [Daldinia caldariorum]KAI1464050.1 hypothetical protein F4812DRAFT_463111 [Daldinia caldariorum]
MDMDTYPMDYPMSSLLMAPHGNDGANSLGKINSFTITCEFLDSLRTSANRSDGAFATTPNLEHLHDFCLPALRFDRSMGNIFQASPLVNPSTMDNSSTSRDKEQWRVLSWFVWKIDGYRDKLQECLKENIPPGLKDWLTKHNDSTEIRNVGLRGLGDILQDIIPSEFDEILPIMIVQHAIFHYTCETNTLGSVESAFTGWRNGIPIIQTHQSSLDLVFERLKLADRSSGNAQLARPHIQTPLFETGSKFTHLDITSYPQSITDSSLYPPRPLISSPEPNPWTLPGGQSFATGPDDRYLTGYAMENIPKLSYYDPSRIEVPVSFTPAANLNMSFCTTEINPSAFQNQAHQRVGQAYGLSPSPGYSQYENGMSSMSLRSSTPFTVFMKFIDNFTNQGGLPHLFSKGSIRWTKRPLTVNAMVTEKLFFKNTENLFFDPLRNLVSQSVQDPIIQAIISTTSSLILLGGLHSLPDVADYMISLGIHLLPSPDLCRDFARIILQTCPEAGATNTPGRSPRGRGQYQSQSIEKRIEEIVKSYSGAYHPAHLFQSHNTQRSHRTLHPRQHIVTSQASSSQPTPSIVDSVGSNGHNFMDNGADTSIMTSTTIPSLTSTAQCEECGKTFTGKHVSSHLSRHKRQHRNIHVTIECPYCGKLFRHVRTDNIRTHYRNVHGHELPENGKEYWSQLTSTTQLSGRNDLNL